jgi:lysophospholipase L1-like esterase
MRRPLTGLALSLVAIALCAGITEAALRVVFANSLDFGMEMWKYAVALKVPVDDDRLAFVHAPSRRAFLMGVDVAINSSGLRDREYAVPKPPGTFRILVLGDSTTFGWGVRVDETAAKALERALNEPGGRRVEVLNAGVGNYGTVQEVAYYRRRGRDFQPDLVILQYYINDAEPVPRRPDGWLRDRSYFRAFIASRLDGAQRLAGRLPDWRAYYASLYRDDQPGWTAAQAALRELADATAEDGARLLVAVLPELHMINDEYPFAREHALVRAVAAAKGVPSIDLIDGLRGQAPERELWVTPLDAHPNARANRLVAAQLKAWITREVPPAS